MSDDPKQPVSTATLIAALTVGELRTTIVSAVDGASAKQAIDQLKSRLDWFEQTIKQAVADLRMKVVPPLGEIQEELVNLRVAFQSESNRLNSTRHELAALKANTTDAITGVHKRIDIIEDVIEVVIKKHKKVTKRPTSRKRK